MIEVVSPEHPPLCGHINRHHTDEKGQLSPLACTLSPGHAGDHYARYTRLYPDPIVDHRGTIIKMNYTTGEAETYWNDIAGTPAKDIKPEQIDQLTAYQQDLIMQVLRKNPGMTAQDALAEARNSKAWR